MNNHRYRFAFLLQPSIAVHDKPGVGQEEVSFFCLPHEIIACVLSYVPHKQLLTSVSLVCKKFHRVISEDRLLPTDLEIDISSYSPKFEVQSLQMLKIIRTATCMKYLTIHVNNQLCKLLKTVATYNKQLRGLKILYSTGNFISLKEKEECSGHLMAIADECKHLKEVRLLINCSFYKMDLIKQMLISRRNTLSVLEIDSFELNSNVFQHISNCKMLEELKLPKFEQLNKPCFQILYKTMTNIKTLELCVRRLSDDCLAQNLARCKSLEELTLHHANRLSKNGIFAISKLHTLKKLQMNVMSRGLLKSEDMIQAFIQGNLDNLELLELTGYLDLYDHGLISIVQRFPNLKCLILDGCNNVTALGRDYLINHCKHLHLLKINGKSASNNYALENVVS